MRSKLTVLIGVAAIAGVLAGYLANTWAPDAKAAAEIAGYFSILADIFLRLIKMIIAPLVFATVVHGIAATGDTSAVGRIGLKAVGWFVTASLVSLILGMTLAHLFQPGANLALPLPETGLSTNLKTGSLSLKDFIVHVFPKSFFEAMASNEILQILVFSLLFGIAITALKGRPATTIMQFTDDLVHVMLKLTEYVMLFAPFGVFGAIAAAIATQGIGILAIYGKFIGTFFASLVILWMLLIAAGFVFLRGRVFTLLSLLREPMMIGFSTASSEAAFPKMIEQLERFGANERVTALTLPLGYSFNLDGSMIYQAFVTIFIAQAYGIEMSLGQQITMLLVMMLSSKGVAGVPRASLVVIAATLPMFGLPEAGLLLILGIDHFLDMGRTVTNVVGNGIATAVVAKWEGELGPTLSDSAVEAPAQARA